MVYGTNLTPLLTFKEYLRKSPDLQYPETPSDQIAGVIASKVTTKTNSIEK